MKKIRPQVHAHRTALLRAGLAALCLLSATACIFEQSTYQGGGRVDKGAGTPAGQPASEPEPEPEPQVPADDGSAQPDAAPPRDASTGG